MKKLALKLNELSVESFPTVADRVDLRGTVNGQQLATMPPCFVEPAPNPPTVPSDSWRISQVCEPYTQNETDNK